MLTPHPYVVEGFMTSCSFDYFTQNSTQAIIVITTTFTFGFAVPFAITIAFYILIYRNLKLRALERKAVFNSTFSKASSSVTSYEASKLSKQPLKKGLVRSSFLTIVSFGLLWLPYSIMTFITQFSPNRANYITPTSIILPVMIAKSSAVMNPIVYVFSNKTIMSKIKKIIMRKKACLATTNFQLKQTKV
jgi:hypothetical protein